MKKFMTVILMAAYIVVFVACGKTEFQGTAAPQVPVEFASELPAPPPATPGPKVWGEKQSIGTIGIYIGSAQKYGRTVAPVPGSACDSPHNTAYDLSTCAPNGALCTSAGTPSDQFLCCTNLTYQDCR